MCLKMEIEILREQLNILIEQESNYENILELSKKLDDLINR